MSNMQTDQYNIRLIRPIRLIRLMQTYVLKYA